jgi:membrane protein DedA with SNARE-associated domain
VTGGAGWLPQLLDQYGYLAVFALVGLESAGIPLPGETMLIAAAIYAGSTGRLSLAGVLAAAISGAVLGDNAGYAAGRYGGWPLLYRYARYLRLREKDLKTGRYLFARHGGTVVFFGRFVSILRICAAFLAGANRMRWPRFAVLNAAGGITWAASWGHHRLQLRHSRTARLRQDQPAARRRRPLRQHRRRGLATPPLAAARNRRRGRLPRPAHPARPQARGTQQTVPASVPPAGGKEMRPCQR